MPKESPPELVVPHVIPDDERVWVPVDHSVWFRPLCMSATHAGNNPGGYPDQQEFVVNLTQRWPRGGADRVTAVFTVSAIRQPVHVSHFQMTTTSELSLSENDHRDERVIRVLKRYPIMSIFPVGQLFDRTDFTRK